MFDIIIIGAGPAGISAALYAKRANLNVLVLYHGESQLEKAHQIDNYYGFEKGISGKDLYQAGIYQAKNLGVQVIQAEVTNIQYGGPSQYILTANDGSSSTDYQTPAVIIATGNKRLSPDIAGLKALEGHGVSYCAVCDGFFYRKKDVCVIGNQLYAWEEASYLANMASSVTILTDGKDDSELKALYAQANGGIAYSESENCDPAMSGASEGQPSSPLAKIRIDSRKIASIAGIASGNLVSDKNTSDCQKNQNLAGGQDSSGQNLENGDTGSTNSESTLSESPAGDIQDKVSAVTFEEGSPISCEGVFVALGSAGGADFAKKLGLTLEGNSIKTDEKMQTAAKGIFSCGNVNGGLLQVCKAVYEGGVAGLSAIEYVKSLKK